MAKKTKKFGGKVYSYCSVYPTILKATSAKLKKQKEGFSVRIVPSTAGFKVFTRKAGR